MLVEILLLLTVLGEKLAKTGSDLLDSDRVARYTFLIGLIGAGALMIYAVAIVVL